MYTESIGSRKTIGDVDVLYVDGIYHLFHLVLPNHDYVAHAVSNDCFHWRRVENALFLGHPGSWDDSMLWTVHVTRHPFRKGAWRMFYTGLSRRDHGLKQRIGVAESDDLYRWTKSPTHWVDGRSALPYDLPGRPPQPPYEYDADSQYPLGPDSRYYEAEVDEGRKWISWRDPFYYREGDRGWLLTAGRVNQGPVVRRGCVALLEEISEGNFEVRPALHHPAIYDDVEVPNLIKLDGEYYLIGSIREDAKVRYWHSQSLQESWRSYHDNVLLAAGNYAGRICEDDRGYLLWSFYTPNGLTRTSHNLMPPPKRLVRKSNGQLRVQSFEGFDDRVARSIDVSQICSLKRSQESHCVAVRDRRFRLISESSFQAFLFGTDVDCFRFTASISMAGEGKCGIVFRIDRESHDGYYLSLDLFKGVAQLRAWGTNPQANGEEMMRFESLQSGYWEIKERGEAEILLIVHGSYVELSIEGRVILALADQTYRHGGVGLYVEAAEMEVQNVALEQLHDPIQSDEHLTVG